VYIINKLKPDKNKGLDESEKFIINQKIVKKRK
jgi:hypothetical protein